MISMTISLSSCRSVQIVPIELSIISLSIISLSIISHTNIFPSPSPSPQMGHFMYAAKAFDVLERLDPEPEYWEGKRGACVGVFQLMIAGKASRDDLQDVLTMVRNTSNPQVEYIVRIIQKWCKDNNVKIA